MKKLLFVLAVVLISLHFQSIYAQKQIELTDIVMTNLGDDQMYAHKRDDSKTPIDGNVRIITGVTTEYIDANFVKGYGEGEWKYFRKNKLTVEVNFKNGYTEGAYVEYYPSGDIKEKGQYVKGQKNGTWETLKSDGVIKLTEVFENGGLTKKITYYTDGKVDSERNFKNGKENGAFIQYTFEGELKSNKNYVNGKQVGKQIQHYSSNAGNYIQTSNYDDNGMLDGEYSEIYAENGAVKLKGRYKKGRKIGKWTYGYKHQLYKEETYEDGKLIETTKLNR